MKWHSIVRLLKLAVINDRLTEEQAEYLENKYCR